MGIEPCRRYVAFVLLLLGIVFINLTVSSSSLGPKYGVGNSFKLSPPYGTVVDPLAYPGIAGERHLGPIIVEQIKQAPDILSLSDDSIGNMFLQLPNGQPVKVFFSEKKELEIDSSLKLQLKNVFIIPCYFGDKLYFARLVIYKDIHRQPDIEIYPEEEARARYDELEVPNDKTLYFISSADESVQAVGKFLERIGAEIANMRFGGLVGTKKLILSEDPIPEVGIIAVSEARDVKKRAYSILGTMFTSKGVSYHTFEKAFDRFWQVWQKNMQDEFKLDDVSPELISLVRQLERDFKGESNEGPIVLDKPAYEEIQETVGLSLYDCDNTIGDIKRIFRKVAKHMMRKHNQAAAKEKEAAAERIIDACKKAVFASAKKAGRGNKPNTQDFQIPIADIKEIPLKALKALREAGLTNALKILKAKTKGLLELDEIGQRMKPILPREMPGLGPDNIYFHKISESNGALPTDLVFEDGIVWINENFVQLMYKMGYEWGMRGTNGNIYDHRAYGAPYETRLDYPPEDSEHNTVIGNMYESIIYSVAWHTYGGHFPINQWGFAEFNRNEYWAQGERGGGDYSYVNIFSMFFYWIEMLEMHRYPLDRCETLLAKYPQILRKFGEISKEHEEEIKKRMPQHLFRFFRDMLDKQIIPMPYKTIKTKQTRETVQRILEKKHPEAVSNEGGTDSRDGRESDESKFLKLVYSTIPMTGRQEQMVQEIAESVEVMPEGDRLKELKGRIFEVTESRWSDFFLDAINDGPHPESSERSGEKIILAIETDWVGVNSDEQSDWIQELVQGIFKLNGKESTVEVVRADSGALYTELMKARDREGASLENIVVLASQSTLAKGTKFDNIRAEAFLAGVDPGNLGQDSYIRLMEMLTMAVRMAFGQRPVSRHLGIKIDKDEQYERNVTFTPIEPEPINHNDKVYRSQLQVILSAA